MELVESQLGHIDSATGRNRAFPINIIWGPEFSQIYNDGYRVVCGEAHTRALGEGRRRGA